VILSVSKTVTSAANFCLSVTLVASDEAIAAAEKDAINAASKDARSQAEAALGALQLKQQEIVSIQINSARPSLPAPMSSVYSQNNVVGDMAISSVVAGEQKVQAFVTLQVRYQPAQ
jgi:hypothetical protein